MFPVFMAAGILGLTFGVAFGPVVGAGVWYATIAPAFAGAMLATRK